MSKQTERDAFRSRWGFILACIGSAVGMGNIWRFPYLVSAWGGMTFLLPYFLFVLLIGSTGIIGELLETQEGFDEKKADLLRASAESPICPPG